MGCTFDRLTAISVRFVVAPLNLAMFGEKYLFKCPLFKVELLDSFSIHIPNIPFLFGCSCLGIQMSSCKRASVYFDFVAFQDANTLKNELARLKEERESWKEKMSLE